MKQVMNMTLRHLRVFAAVCDTLNMTKAAQELYMTQSAVSQAISELEASYGVKLFERLSKKLYLTQAGEKLIGYARHMIRLEEDAESEMRNLREKSRIRVGASVTVGSSVLPGLAAALKRELPRLGLEVTEDNTAAIERLLLLDKLDIGLVEGTVRSPELLVFPFAQDRLALVCGREHPFYSRSLVEPKELEQENWILREAGSGTRSTFEEAMERHGLKWSSSWTCNNADTIKAAVAEGLGVSMISERTVRQEIETGLLRSVPVNGLSPVRDFQLVYHKSKYLTPALEEFLSFCRSRVR